MAKLVIQPRACNEAMAQALPRAVLSTVPVQFCRFLYLVRIQPFHTSL